APAQPGATEAGPRPPPAGLGRWRATDPGAGAADVPTADEWPYPAQAPRPDSNPRSRRAGLWRRPGLRGSGLSPEPRPGPTVQSIRAVLFVRLWGWGYRPPARHTNPHGPAAARSRWDSR